MKKTYQKPSMVVVQVQGTDAILQISLTGQQGSQNPSVTPTPGTYDGPAATKGNEWGNIWEK